MELTWVESPPDGTESPPFPHDSVAAMARAHTGRWIAVPGMPPNYASDIVDGRLTAYQPRGAYASLYRNGTVYLTFVGRDPWEDFRPGEFAPVKVAVVDYEDIPPSRPLSTTPQHGDAERVADALRARPGRWAVVPGYVVAGPWVISAAGHGAFAPKGAFEAVGRGWQTYARCIAPDAR